MSKWKTVRKERLSEFGRYENTRGWIGGLAMTWLGFALAKRSSVLFVFVLLALATYWLYGYRYEGRFTRIEKAIDDAGGDA